MQGKKLLIVDDEADIRTLLKEYLELEGYRVWTAANVAEAQKALTAGPDLIILDIALPGIDGLLWCRQIRDTLPVPILFLSARAGEKDRIKGLQAGGDDYIVKPFSLEELSARIAAFLFTNKGHVFTKDQIYEKVRGCDGEADVSVVTEHIRRIRAKLGADWEREYIETVWGVGYRWIG